MAEVNTPAVTPNRATVRHEVAMAELTPEYHRLRDMLLNDISRDTDKILTKLEDCKGKDMDMSAFMAGQNSNRGLDTAMMMNGGNMWNNPFMYLIWLAMFGYGNFGGFGGRGMPAGNQGVDAMLLQAINQGSNTAQRDIDRLATSLGCGQSELRTGLNVLNTAITQVAGQVGMSVPQVVNAIQAGNSMLAAQLANCCCENRLAICQQTNTLTNGQASLGFLIQNEGNQTRAQLTQQNYEAQLRALAKENEDLRASAQTAVLLNNNNTQTGVINTTLAQMSGVLAQILARVSSTTTTE